MDAMNAGAPVVALEDSALGLTVVTLEARRRMVRQS
jgi:hypothetical protein